MHQGKTKVQKSLVKHIPSLLLIKVLFSSLFFFMQPAKVLFTSIFHHAAAFQVQHFPVLIVNKSLPCPQINLPTSLSMCAHVSSVWLCNYVTNTLNFVGQENKPVYAELSCAFHDKLSKDGVQVNIPLIWVLDIKFIVLYYFTTSDIRCGKLWFRIWMAQSLFTVLYMT